MQKRLKYWSIGIATGIAFFSVFGLSTALIPSPFFLRMIEANVLDYVFLTSSSILLGAITGVVLYKKNAKKCAIATYSGGFGSFLAFSCPICIKLLALLFGAAALMTYFEPYRPLLGVGSTALLGGALYCSARL